MLWKELKCGSKLWDPKIEYEAIGKDPRQDYDEVCLHEYSPLVWHSADNFVTIQIFMVSSLNHHVSILKFTVHSAYTEYVRTEQLPTPLPNDPNWSSPRLQRTMWYNFFDVDERVQAYRAIWGITAYLMRETNKPSPPATAAGASEQGKAAA